MAKNITKQTENFSNWYVDVINQAKLADYSPVKGSMVIRPNGYAIWENIQKTLDGFFKETGHQNAYFPLLIPHSFLEREADHVEGFAPELAIVTKGGGKTLEEPLVVRPTSETIINAMFSKWVQSYRDLPLLINQWANVVRWELRTKLFLRTTEFLWQEGHTCHVTKEEAEEETLKMLGVYKKFLEEYMAIPVIDGEKTDSERFAGALKTYSVEILMKDGKGLQAGTTHFLGQNFSKKEAFDINFQDKDGKLKYVWQSSWGVSTRLIGALIMVHGDDNGLRIPPKLAPIQVAIVPIVKKNSDNSTILTKVKEIEANLKKQNIRVKLDDDINEKPGSKYFKYEIEGVPLRIDLGPRDLEENKVTIARRDTGEKSSLPISDLEAQIPKLLEEIQNNMFNEAKKYLETNTHTVDTYDEFKEKIKNNGMILAHWCGSSECETKIKEDTKATIRCISFEYTKEDGKCIACDKASKRKIHFAKAQ